MSNADHTALVAELLDTIRMAELELAELRSVLDWVRTMDPDQLELFRDGDRFRVQLRQANGNGHHPEPAPEPEPELADEDTPPGLFSMDADPRVVGKPIRRRQEETTRLARDWARLQGENWWRAKEMGVALGYSRGSSSMGGTNPLAVALRTLIEQGTVVTNGTPVKSPNRLYRWAGKPEPVTPIRNGGGKGSAQAARFGGAAVAGTGRDRIASTDKDYARAIQRARARGWRIDAAGATGHDALVWRDGTRVPLARTPSDHRSVANLEGQLRRAERGVPT